MIKIPKTKKGLIIVLIGIIFLLFVLFNLIFGSTEVKSYQVKKQNAIKGVTVTGTVESDNDLRLNSSVTAKVKEIRFKEGEFVRKGQILAILDRNEILGNLTTAEGQLETATAQVQNLLTEPRIQQVGIARAQLQEAQENAQTSESNYQRARVQLRDAISNESRLTRLYEQGAVSFREAETARFARIQAQENVQSLQNQIGAARARVSQTQENLSLIQAGTKSEQIQAARGQVQAAKGGIQTTEGRLDNYTIYSPITGYIVEKLLDKGEVASPTSPIVRMVKPESEYINAQVEENQLKNVKVGQETYIVFDAYPNQTFVSRVYEVIKNVNPITGSFQAKIHPPYTKGKAFMAGMTADVTIITEKFKNAITIPSEFVYTQNQKTFVFKKRNNKAVKTYVEGGLFDNEKFLVTKGVNANDIIVKGYKKLPIKNNSRISIKESYRD